MAAVNKIIYGGGGSDFFDFDGMKGDPQPKQTQIQVIAEPGFDGEILRDLGVRGVPFQLLTRRYVANRAAAVTLVASYVALNGATVSLLFHNTAFGYFRILNLSAAEPKACNSAIGTIAATPAAFLDAAWTLVSTEAP